MSKAFIISETTIEKVNESEIAEEGKHVFDSHPLSIDRDETKGIHEIEVQDAKNHDRTEPDRSNTVEMLLRKGVRAYKTGASKE